jgi:hypothetical protein
MIQIRKCNNNELKGPPLEPWWLIFVVMSRINYFIVATFEASAPIRPVCKFAPDRIPVPICDSTPVVLLIGKNSPDDIKRVPETVEEPSRHFQENKMGVKRSFNSIRIDCLTPQTHHKPLWQQVGAPSFGY